MESMNHLFIMGVTPRCGTNYLSSLLCLHPWLTPSQIYEEWLFNSIRYTEEFVQAVEASQGRKSWSRPEHLRHEIGQAFSRYLCVNQATQPLWLVSKTPSPYGANRVSDYLPSAKILFITRDPRDIAVSRKISFGVAHQQTYQEWFAAQTWMERCVKQFDVLGLLKYEDVVSNPRACAETTWSEIGGGYINGDTFFTDKDFTRLPIKGSSDIVRAGEPIDWSPRPWRPDFQPVGRWKRDGVEEPPEHVKTEMRKWGYEC